MSNESWNLNPDYDERAILERAVQNLLKLDAEGCRIVKAVADAMIDFGNWLPRDPAYKSDITRAECGEQARAFKDLCEVMVGYDELALQIAPLAEARQKYQAEVEEQEADDEHRVKRNRRRQPQSKAQVLSIVPKTNGSDGPSGQEE